MNLRPSEKDAVDAFDAELANRNIEGMWKLYATPPSNEPKQVLQTYLWKWSEIQQYLKRAGDIIPLGPKEERRVLRLVNPGMQGRRATTQTMQMSYQLVNPGEFARAHRHSIAAIRFIVSGRGAFTTVQGEKIYMAPGDLILTPSWMWHDHGNDTDEPIVWIDGLDSPLVSYLGVGFFEHFGLERQDVIKENKLSQSHSFLLKPASSERMSSTTLKYSWDEALAALREREQDAFSRYDGVLLEYSNPSNAGHTFPTLSCCIQMLRPGEQTETHRHTSGTAYHVVRGRGCSVIGKVELQWQAGDCFVVPPWFTHAHSNSSKESDAVLFSINDSPVLETLGLYRSEGI